MKFKDIGFRVWDNESKEYNQEREVLLSSNGSIYRIHTITGELQQLKEESLELELYTGLTDSNGIKIYVGDIIEIRYYYDFEIQAEIILEDFAFKAKIIEVGNKESKEKERLFLKEILNAEIEVISNIHENKD